MKAIAVVTMTFLPATFVAVSRPALIRLQDLNFTKLSLQSIFSMSFFHFEPSVGDMKESFVVSGKFWMYWVLAAPLSITALGFWKFWDGKLDRQR